MPHVAIFVAVALLYGFGLLEFLEYKLADARFKLLEREATADLVIVEIDPPSLQLLDSWPWPRTYHARLLDELRAAGAARIALDIDFSSRSTPELDAALEQALAAVGGSVILPAFSQNTVGPDGKPRRTPTAPLARFAQHSRLASVNVVPESDGRVRRVMLSEAWGQTTLPTLFTRLAEPAMSANGAFYIDFAIRPSSIPSLSFADVLLGLTDLSIVEGKHVLIGSTAMELGDQVPVPVYGVMPGSVLQAMAYQSLIQGRALQRLAPLPVLLLTFLATILLAPRFRGWTWRGGLLALALFSSGLFAAATRIQALLPLTLDLVPLLLAAFLSYAFFVLSRIDQQDLRLMAQSLAIRRKDAFLAQVVENSSDGIVTIDDAGRVTSFNRAAQDIFGCNAADIVEQPIEALWAGHVADTAGADLDGILKLRGGPHELSGRSCDNRSITIELAVSEMVMADERVRILLIRDVTEQRQAEAEAEAAHRRLSESIECIQEGFALYDKADRLRLCNRKFREMFEIPPSPPGLRFEEAMRRAAEQGRIIAARGRVPEWLEERLTRHRAPRGVHQETLSNGTCLLVSERRTFDGGTVAVYADITELKQREDELRAALAEVETANRSKTEFLANMNHELRTPLNAIIGFSEFMTSEALGPIGTPKYKAYAQDIHDSGRRLLDAINDILKVSRIEAGQHSLHEEDLDIAAIIESCLRIVTARAEQQNHDIRVELPTPCPLLRADEAAVKQVLVNLLTNAVRFTAEGDRISVTGHVAEDGGLVILIADRGIGIAPEDTPKALAYFGQVDSKLARRHEGAGLGLPLAKRLMDLHGGTLSLESRPGQGTTVTLRFPADRVIAGEAPVKAAKSA